MCSVMCVWCVCACVRTTPQLPCRKPRREGESERKRERERECVFGGGGVIYDSVWLRSQFSKRQERKRERLRDCAWRTIDQPGNIVIHHYSILMIYNNNNEMILFIIIIL